MNTLRRPLSVVTGIRLLVLSLLIDIISFVLGYSFTWVGFAALMVIAALMLYLLYLCFQGVSWPRYVLAVIAGLGILVQIAGFGEGYSTDSLATLVEIVSTVITVVGIVLLFIKSSNAWFSQPRLTNRA